MKIYTKTGDNGETSIFTGKRLDKDSIRIEAIGTVDELNSIIGIILTCSQNKQINQKLLRIQRELFGLGFDLATPLDSKVSIKRTSLSQIRRLETEINDWNKKLPKLENFILPGGSELAANLHFGRTVARRAERAIVKLSHQEKINRNIIPFINRLSDWLFTLARFANYISGVKEVLWKKI
ncbi:MAG: cob(I)yrinic acid a,c-diamide adenosyltransferase [Nitrososphaerota archaeon]